MAETISNAAFRRKILAATEKAGLTEDGLTSFIVTTTADAPYFLQHLKRALPSGSTVTLPGAAAKDFDDWVRALHAGATGAGKTSAKRLNAILFSTGAAPAAGRAPARKAVSKKKTTSRKPAAKKTTSRKSAAKKTTSRKPAAKKTTSRKPAAKKTFLSPSHERAAKRADKKKTSRKKVTTRRPSQEQAAARAVVDEATRAAVKRARARGLTGPMKITFDLVVERI